MKLGLLLPNQGVVFGATVLGWVGALIWAMNKIDDPLKGGIKHDPQTNDPMV